MKHKLLASLMFTAALSQIACSQSSGDKISSCLKDQVCKQTVAAMSGATGPQLFPLGTQTAVQGQVPTTTGLINQPFRISSVANAAIKTQSAKVAAAIAADDANPLSTYYKSPTPQIPTATVNTRAPASTSTASIEPIAQGTGGSITGEAAR